jgi:hypothetical protein
MYVFRTKRETLTGGREAGGVAHAHVRTCTRCSNRQTHTTYYSLYIEIFVAIDFFLTTLTTHLIQKIIANM